MDFFVWCARTKIVAKHWSVPPWELSGKHSPLEYLKLTGKLTYNSDLSDAFPGGDYADYFRNPWVLDMVKETKSNREFTARTIETARWAREQIKRQTGMSSTQHLPREDDFFFGDDTPDEEDTYDISQSKSRYIPSLEY